MSGRVTIGSKVPSMYTQIGATLQDLKNGKKKKTDLGKDQFNFNLTEEQIRDFMHDLDHFNVEFGYSRDPTVVESQKANKNSLYREMNDVQSMHYRKYFHGLVPDDPKNKFYYGMSNPTYYSHNMINVESGDQNDGNMVNGQFKTQQAGRQNGYYYGQMRANEYKRYLGTNRVFGNNERSGEHQIDPRIIDSANLILQHQERLKTRLREKYRKANSGIIRQTEDQKYRNRQMMAMYNNIEGQQKMIQELVNNTITNREKDLKLKNAELKKRIEAIEAKMPKIQESDDSDGDYKTEKINAKMRKLEDKMNPSKKRALITMPDGAVMEEGQEGEQMEFAEEFVDHAQLQEIKDYKPTIQLEEEEPSARTKIAREMNHQGPNSGRQLPPLASSRALSRKLEGVKSTSHLNMFLPRKTQFYEEDQDNKQRLNSPADAQQNKLNFNILPSMKVPSYFPELPRMEDASFENRHAIQRRPTIESPMRNESMREDDSRTTTKRLDGLHRLPSLDHTQSGQALQKRPTLKQLPSMRESPGMNL